MSKKPMPPRLHVVFAREARTAVVIRRGPSRVVCTIGWNRDTDTFKIGQWLGGRIYERRTDLSPDGEHFIYFAMNGHWTSKSRGSWTAISRAPYLKAEVFLPKGDCWQGGGLFLSDRKYWVNGQGCHHPGEPHRSKLELSCEYPWHETYGGECPGVYFIRLQRDGWKRVKGSDNGRVSEVTFFEKPAGGDWVLEKRAHADVFHPEGRGVYWDEHALLQTRTGDVLDFPHWEWADLDGDRLVWAEQGKLFSGRLSNTGLKAIRELHDFNGMAFQRIEAPY